MDLESRDRSSHALKARWLHRHGGAFVLAILVAGASIPTNLPYSYVESETETIGFSQLGRLAEGRSEALAVPMMAGYPLRYWVRYEREGLVQDVFWSVWRLVFNLVCWLGLAVGLWGFVWARSRLLVKSKTSTTRIGLDLATSLLILLVPATPLIVSQMAWKRDLKLVQSAPQNSSFYASCWLPSPVSGHIPTLLKERMRRIRIVEMTDADPIAAQSVSRLAELAELRLVGGTYSASNLESLKSNPHFACLHLNRRKLPFDQIEFIKDLRWLHGVGFRYSKLTDEGLQQLQLPTSVTHIDLHGTSIDISKLGRPSWAEHVKYLALMRPYDGVDIGPVMFHDWPKLESLVIDRFSRRLNATELNVSLSNLPRLSHLQLSRVQKYRLSINSVPLLGRIANDFAEIEQLIGDDVWVPSALWASELTIKGANALTSLNVHASELQRFDVEGKAIRSVKLSTKYYGGFGTYRHGTADPELVQEWVSRISEFESLRSIDLSNISLRGIDLSPLSGLTSLREINFDRTDVSYQQLQELESLVQLDEVALGSCNLVENELSRLLGIFPNVRQLLIDGGQLERVDLSGSPNLRELTSSVYKNATVVRVSDMPLLHTSFRLASRPEVFEIRGAQSLVGIAIESPWPDEYELEGLRKLHWFAAGGKNVDDELLSALEPCQNLDLLTLAYPKLSRDALAGIGEFHQLSLLSIPGADVDDEVTQHWSQLKRLWEVNLDDTRVSSRTLMWLQSLGALRRISLNRVDLGDSKTTADMLNQMDQILELQLAGSTFPMDAVASLVRGGTLEALNLSGTKWNDSMTELFGPASGLRWLALHGSEIDPNALERLLELNPDLHVDVGVNPDIEPEKLSNRERLYWGDQSLQHERFLKLPNVETWDRYPAYSDVRVPSDIGPFVLRPYEQGRISIDPFRPSRSADSVSTQPGSVSTQPGLAVQTN